MKVSAVPTILAVAAFLWTPALGRVLLSQQEALDLVFGDAQVERRTAYLDDEQLEQVKDLAGSEPSTAIVPHYVAAGPEGMLLGVAYFDTHRVRTEAETVMVVVGPDGSVIRVETVAFNEPPDYLARGAWLDQFDGRELDRELQLKRGIRPMTGATLTAGAITAAVRRVLALHRIIAPGPPEGADAPDPAPGADAAEHSRGAARR